MNKNQKIMLGIGAAVLFCLCVAGVSFLALRAVVNKAKEAIITDPAQVSAVANEIAEYDLPPGYTEQMAMNFGLYQIVVITSADLNDKPMIMLMSFNASGASPEQMQEQLQRTLEQQAGSSGVTWDKTEQRQMTIRGQKVNVVVREGRDRNNQVMRQLVAVFQGKNDQVIVMIQGRVEAWDDKQIDDFLKSIK